MGLFSFLNPTPKNENVVPRNHTENLNALMVKFPGNFPPGPGGVIDPTIDNKYLFLKSVVEKIKSGAIKLDEEGFQLLKAQFELSVNIVPSAEKRPLEDLRPPLYKELQKLYTELEAEKNKPKVEDKKEEVKPADKNQDDEAALNTEHTEAGEDGESGLATQDDNLAVVDGGGEDSLARQDKLERSDIFYEQPELDRPEMIINDQLKKKGAKLGIGEYVDFEEVVDGQKVLPKSPEVKVLTEGEKAVIAKYEELKKEGKVPAQEAVNGNGKEIKKEEVKVPGQNKVEVKKVTPKKEVGDIYSTKITVGAVEVEDLVKKASRDTAYRRDQEDDKKAQEKGWLGRKWHQIKKGVTGELMTELNRKKIEQGIRDTRNLNHELEGTTRGQSNEELTSVVSRFTSEYGSRLVESSIGETREVLTDSKLQADVKKFIELYVKGETSSADLDRRQNDLVEAIERAAAAKLGGKVGTNRKEREFYANNLVETAQKFKDLVGAREDVDFSKIQVEIIAGRAKQALKTKLDHNAVEELGQKISDKTAGIINASTAALGMSALSPQVAGGIAATASLLGKTISGPLKKFLAWGTFGATATYSGVAAGVKKGRMLENDKYATLREAAMGQIPVNTSELRNKLLESSVAYESAAEIRNSISETLYIYNENNELVEKVLTQEDFNNLVAVVGRTQALINLGNENGADLLKYSHPSLKETERFELMYEMSKAETVLARYSQFGNAAQLIQEQVNIVETGESGGQNLSQELKDKRADFKSMKRSECVNHAVFVTIGALTVGAVAQELFALADFTHTQGVFEGHDSGANGQTVFSKLLGTVSGVRDFSHNVPYTQDFDLGPGGCGKLQMPLDYHFGDGKLMFPEGALDLNGNPIAAGTIIPSDTLVDPDGNILGEHIAFNADGSLTDASWDQLVDHGVTPCVDQVGNVTTEEVTRVSAADYLKKIQDQCVSVHRSWLDNDTAKFDLNELKGYIQVGPKGEAIVDMSHMNGPSWHGAFSTVPMEGSNNVMLISPTEGTQGSPIRIPFGPNGKVSIPKDIQEIFFKKDAAGNWKFIGKYLEIAQESPRTDGSVDVKMFATCVGQGVDDITTTITKTTTGGVTTILEMPSGPGGDLPVIPPGYVPIIPRKMLERANMPSYERSKPNYGKIAPKQKLDDKGPDVNNKKAENNELSEKVAQEKKERREKGKEDGFIYENGAIVILPIEDAKWAKTQSTLINKINNTIAYEEEQLKKSNSANKFKRTFFITSEEEKDSKKVRELVEYLKTDLYKTTEGLGFVFVHPAEKELKLNEVMLLRGSTYEGALTVNIANAKTSFLENVLQGKNVSERTKVLVEQELEKRKIKVIKIPKVGGKDGETVEVKISDMKSESITEHIKAGKLKPEEVSALRAELEKRRKETPEYKKAQTEIETKKKETSEKIKTLAEKLKNKEITQEEFDRQKKAVVIEFKKFEKQKNNIPEGEKNSNKTEPAPSVVEHEPKLVMIKSKDGKKVDEVLLFSDKKNTEKLLNFLTSEDYKEQRNEKIVAAIKKELETRGVNVAELLDASKAAPEAPGTLTPFLEELKKNNQRFSFDKVTNEQLTDIINLAQKTKKRDGLKLAQADLVKGVRVFILGSENGKGIVQSVTGPNVTIKFGENAKDLVVGDENFYGEDKIADYLKSLGIKIEVKKRFNF